MTRATVSQARWHHHVNHVNPPPELRHWLIDRTSLTFKLSARCERFRVLRLRQQQAYCLHDEAAAVGLPRRQCVREREVLLHCDERPMVFAHTVVPMNATATDWPFFSRLGERSLGTTLFGDPRVNRGQLQYARLQPGHPLMDRIHAAVGGLRHDRALYARRCLFKRNNGVLLVTEVFLPGIINLPAVLIQPTAIAA